MSDQTAKPASGQFTTNGTPHGYSSITPFIALDDPEAALDFYRDVFGARLIDATRFGDRLVHAEVEFANGRLQLGCPQPDYHLVAPDLANDDVTGSLALYCPDADAVVEAAVAHGAVLREPAVTFVSGDRYASIRDPFGVRWTVMTRVEDLSDQQSQARIAEWAATQG